MSQPDDEPLTDEEWANLTIDELISRSSFGTPEAVALRNAIPPEITQEILARLRAHWNEANP